MNAGGVGELHPYRLGGAVSVVGKFRLLCLVKGGALSNLGSGKDRCFMVIKSRSGENHLGQ